jgi:heme exporter protein D
MFTTVSLLILFLVSIGAIMLYNYLHDIKLQKQARERRLSEAKERSKDRIRSRYKEGGFY